MNEPDVLAVIRETNVVSLPGGGGGWPESAPNASGFDSSAYGDPLDEANPSGDDGVVRLPFASLSEALGETPSEPEWLLDGYLAPGQLTLLAGRPKVGKSTFLFGLLEALQSGTEFIGRPVRRTAACCCRRSGRGRSRRRPRPSRSTT